MIRPLQLNDDLEQVAHLIYNTDLEAFGMLFGKRNKAIPKLIRLLKKEHSRLSHNCTHICIEKDKIQGILIAYNPQAINYKKEEQDYLDTLTTLQSIVISIKNFFIEFLFNTKGLKGLYIQNISVHPDMRGKGIGSKLVEYYKQLAIDQKVNSLWLDVALNNLGAKKLYERLGFVLVSTKKIPFMNDGAYRMKMELDLKA